VVLQSLTNVAVAGTALILFGERKPGQSLFSGGVSWRDWAIVGLGYFGAHACNLAALKHIIYPLQVVIKSCKAIPVMAGEIVLARTRVSAGQIWSVIQLSVGVGLFMFFSDLADPPTARPGKNAAAETGGPGTAGISQALLYGVAFAGGALVCDAIYGPYQNRICQHHNPSAWHLMFNLNLYQLGFALVAAIHGGQIEPAYTFVAEHWREFGPRLAGFCLSMTLGNIFISQMQRQYGALAVAKTTTVRKLVSVSLSVLLFGHSLTLAQIAAVGLVFLAPVAEKSVDRLFGHHKKHDIVNTALPAGPTTEASVATDSLTRMTAKRTKNGAQTRSASRKRRN
jgi:UDP-galactose transporter B1